MKAIIIAAGASTRLRPLTDEMPKCMLDLNGKTILERSIGTLKNNGIADISIIKGFKKEKISYANIFTYAQ